MKKEDEDSIRKIIREELDKSPRVVYVQQIQPTMPGTIPNYPQPYITWMESK